MAVVTVSEVPSQRTGGWTRNGGKLERTYTRVFQVITDDPDNDDSFVVLTADGIPTIGESHPSDGAARVASKSAKETNAGGKVKWEVGVDYSTLIKGQFPWYPYTPAQISYGAETRQVAVDRDNDGEPMLNTAGDPYDPPFTIDQPVPTLTIRVNLLDSDFSPSWLNQFFMAVNDSSFSIDGQSYAKRTCLVNSIGADPAEYTDEDSNEYTYYQCSITVAVNDTEESGWQPNLLSQGLRELVENEDEEVERKNIEQSGREVSGPVPLDEDGAAIFGDPDEVKEQCVYTRYKVYDEISFSDLEF